MNSPVVNREESSSASSEHSSLPEETHSNPLPIHSRYQILFSSVHGEIEVESFKRHSFFFVLYHFLGVFSFGLLYLINEWYPVLKVNIVCYRSILSEATHLIVTGEDSPPSVCDVIEEIVDHNFPNEYTIFPYSESNEYDDGADENLIVPSAGPSYRFINYQLVKYVWKPATLRFEELATVSGSVKLADLASRYRGFSAGQRHAWRQLYGPNKITIHVPSYFTLLWKEAINFFYVFQVFSIALWCFDHYYLYAMAIFIISCYSLSTTLMRTKREKIRLRDMVETNQDIVVDVLCNPDACDDTPQNMNVENVAVESLVPGDVISLSSTGFFLPCDCVLISGTAIVNESMLTGESAPVTKSAVSVSSLSDEIFNSETHRTHTLYCGTELLQTRYYSKELVLAVVVSTGFNTSKGSLVRSIMFPRSFLFSFYRDSHRFIGFLFLIALCGMGYTFYLYARRGLAINRMIIRGLDLITIVVPPALPAAQASGTDHALERLKKQNIHCVSPNRICVAGKAKVVVFDKTGTLTEDSLEVYGVLGVEDANNLQKSALETDVDRE